MERPQRYSKQYKNYRLECTPTLIGGGYRIRADIYTPDGRLIACSILASAKKLVNRHIAEVDATKRRIVR